MLGGSIGGCLRPTGKVWRSQDLCGLPPKPSGCSGVSRKGMAVSGWRGGVSRSWSFLAVTTCYSFPTAPPVFVGSVNVRPARTWTCFRRSRSRLKTETLVWVHLLAPLSADSVLKYSNSNLFMHKPNHELVVFGSKPTWWLITLHHHDLLMRRLWPDESLTATVKFLQHF